jgi:gliding motility-associated-like protein
MKSILGILLCVFWGVPVLAQVQACPANSNFALGALNHWSAYTYQFQQDERNDTTSHVHYDTPFAAPVGTIGLSTIPEYALSTVGAQVLTSPTTDFFGNFQTVPTINGYKYAASVKLGSTTISTGNNGSVVQGGYVRGITYLLDVPPGPPGQPYTMTYAYAMVLENGTHNTDQQPLIQATLEVNGTVISCASPEYDLPTFNNTNGGGVGATLDSAAAYAEGFVPSREPSPNQNPNATNGAHLYDVWWKGWREVTFDLSPYRGQQVSLTFEADNCVPGGHFAYAYIALRNTCAGLVITGDTIACTNTQIMYSIPALANASYSWTVPTGWTVVSGGNDTNFITVNPGANSGKIAVTEINSCADLHDTVNVSTAQPTIPGNLAGGTEVCTGINSSSITISGNRGGVIDWISTTNGGGTYDTIADTSSTLVTSNLTATTAFRALVQNGQSCSVDTTSSVTVLVDPKTIGGNVSPASTEVCLGQFKGAILTLTNAVGGVTNWQDSTAGSTWNMTAPTDTTHTYDIVNLAQATTYRAIVKSGVCPADTSATAFVNLLPFQFPQATIDPADTLICYGSTANLTANITLGTSYSWSYTAPLSGDVGSGNINGPTQLNAVASPLDTASYMLSIYNAGCPYPLLDTFQVNVYPKIDVFAGNDTAVVVGQPLQFNASATEGASSFTWNPGTDLNNPDIYDPIGTYGSNIDSIHYIVTATAANGCTGDGGITVTVFTTQADIFVPSGFTPTVNINNIFRPIYVGITNIQFFRIYDRFGNCVYSTSSTEDGWDGKIHGQLQAPQAYVWMVQGTTYLGKTIFKKGTVVLIQ